VIVIARATASINARRSVPACYGPPRLRGRCRVRWPEYARRRADGRRSTQIRPPSPGGCSTACPIELRGRFDPGTEQIAADAGEATRYSVATASRPTRSARLNIASLSPPGRRPYGSRNDADARDRQLNRRQRREPIGRLDYYACRRCRYDCGVRTWGRPLLASARRGRPFGEAERACL
jgi:hypothetical protein